MNKEEFKKITEYLDKKVILHQTTGETINKDLDISIRLSVAYEELELENRKYKEVIDKAIEYINENWGHWCSNHCKYATETIEILKGSGINE